MDQVGRRNWVKIVVIPLVVAVGLSGVGIAVFEHSTGIGQAISAYREGEERCRKYGLFATAEELNREYNVPSEVYGGEQLLAALKDYNRALGKDPMIANKLSILATPSKVGEFPRAPAIDAFWKQIEPLRKEKSLRIPRDFREGYAMLFPEFLWYRQAAQHTLNRAMFVSDSEEALRLLKDVAWLRSHVTDNYESDFPEMVARGILRSEMEVTAMLSARTPPPPGVREHAAQLLAVEPMGQGSFFRLKVELTSMFHVCDRNYPAEKVFADMGIKPADSQFSEWLKWRKYPRIEKAWKSAAMDIVSYGYEELKAHPPKNFEDQVKFREKLDSRQMRFGYAAATAWFPWHPIGIEDTKPFLDARTKLQQALKASGKAGK